MKSNKSNKTKSLERYRKKNSHEKLADHLIAVYDKKEKLRKKSIGNSFLKLF